MRKVTFRISVVFLLLLSVLSSGLSASASNTTPIEPMYIGITSMSPEISISSTGVITCTDRVMLKKGYKADVIWELQSGTSRLTTTSTWKDSGTSAIPLRVERDAIRGYSYRLKTSVKVYNSSGTLVDDEVKYSRTVSY